MNNKNKVLIIAALLLLSLMTISAVSAATEISMDNYTFQVKGVGNDKQKIKTFDQESI